MGWNGNDIQYLSTIDRVKRLERSTLKPNESGDYDETSPNLTERVEALEAYVYKPVYKNGDTLPTPDDGTSHTYILIGDGTGFVSGGTPILEIDSFIVNSNTLIVSNVSGSIYLYSVYGTLDDAVANLNISSTNLALKRVG